MKKINLLITEWKKGTVGISTYLAKKGFSKDLLRKYVKSGWLESLGYGAYKLSGDKVQWQGAVYALQKQRNSSIHPGAKTALALKGYSHFAFQGTQVADLFKNPTDHLPQWFKNQQWMNNLRITSTAMIDYSGDEMFSEIKFENIPLKVSAPELAILEMLYLVPAYYTFEEAKLIMESLATLRSNLIQQLLVNCNSIKVKRLFLLLAEKNRHSWFKELNIKKIYLGSGKRLVVKNGALDKKYNITVPKEYEG